MINEKGKVIKSASKKKKDKFLPCAYCGKQPEEFKDIDGLYYVGCLNIDCAERLRTSKCKTRRSAIQCWQSRFLTMNLFGKET